MSSKEWFKEWFDSPYYYKLYFKRDEAEAHQFADVLLAHLKPPPKSRMLDVACGKGRFSIYLASKGYDVTGIDLSVNSIEFARKFEHDKLHFYLHDMRLPFWINYYDYAFNFFTSFGYFYTRREHDNAVRTIASSLKPNGILLFDYLNVHYVEQCLIAHEIKKIGETIYEINKWQDDAHFYKKIIVNDPSLNHPLEFNEKVAKLSLGDFTEMMSYQNIQVKEVFGNYQLKEYDINNTPRMIIIAEKNRK
jgi:2-polyprenyl-3-methyl-5-hydroxy-6-metoxy-1,4-benzoquinol methylase